MVDAIYNTLHSINKHLSKIVINKIKKYLNGWYVFIPDKYIENPVYTIEIYHNSSLHKIGPFTKEYRKVFEHVSILIEQETNIKEEFYVIDMKNRETVKGKMLLNWLANTNYRYVITKEVKRAIDVLKYMKILEDERDELNYLMKKFRYIYDNNLEFKYGKEAEENRWYANMNNNDVVTNIKYVCYDGKKKNGIKVKRIKINPI